MGSQCLHLGFMFLSLLLPLTALAASHDELPRDKRRPAQPFAGQDGSYFKFVTRPDIKAPVWSIEVLNKTAVAPGYWFVAPYEIVTQETPGDAWVGPHIYDSSGELVW